ncbi:MAG: helix-turn-helix domain-containing protein [Bacteroidales bacterium]
MTTIYQLNSQELHTVVRNCLLETIEELKTIPSPQIPSDRIDIYEAIELTGLQRHAIYQKTSKKLMPHSRFGKRLVFSRKELTEWLEATTIKKISANDVMNAHLMNVVGRRV